MTDEQIIEAAQKWCLAIGEDGYKNSGDDYDIHELPAFIAGAQWYRDELARRKTQDYTFDTIKQTIRYQYKEYRLPKKQYALAKYLHDNVDKLISRDDIYSTIWGDDVIVDERSIDVHIRNIRRALPGIPIQTVKGIGYIWDVSSNLTKHL